LSFRLQPTDTSTAAGKGCLNMLGVFAEFETNLRRERQLVFTLNPLQQMPGLNI
jgi:hypothetical protein